ncbi:DUF1206 domain-containing protein [Glacieibacterium frigidum]|uniref:DUF1206 domain-containing protein n=1 Tax=Glacieibacterium frigidum TaxID=2593303 RepID=A0A552UEP3_9SPHN|nr:DUF1206 domain-containing protein [Glacieibacterium frigidum]
MTNDSRLTTLARLGFAARGLTYVLIGWFAIAAARSGGAPGDNRAALGSLADSAAGQWLLAVIALGLLGYALWRFSEAWFDPERHGSDAKGLAKRGGFAVSGLVHVGLALFAARLALDWGGGGGSGDAEADEGAAGLMALPGGVWLVGAVGLVLLASAAGNFAEAYKAGFAKYFRGDLPAREAVVGAGRLGYAARGVVFVLVGWFALQAALNHDPEAAGGTGQALRTLQDQPYGPLLLGIVAAGLLLFGVFGIVQARYRQVQVVSPL